ncbi:MAG: hypothetical protein CMJ06_05275 [Pelagibacterales bacterium]|nr:hypothetical protein [Pelagibacterales bacterium]OUU61573.1 MAG: hypothetical protein CBC22_07340 [Alphaproteobacteria bacterium TMED62]
MLLIPYLNLFHSRDICFMLNYKVYYSILHKEIISLKNFMIIKKFLIFSTLAILGLMVFVVFFWDIPAPQNKIEKDLEIHRLKQNE